MVADLLVVGLGNPGAEYARTRHNLGAEVVEILAKRHGARLRKTKDRALVDDIRLGGKQIVLAVPTTYMNDSGVAIGAMVKR
ncbi:MAG TPA: aminoacyl-tRNA hydrolase, partial [Acidimicrobiia bacterium]|nr:aminoacyl-tRNA hydrolase [Acidimicrobiia bacterium]